MAWSAPEVDRTPAPSSGDERTVLAGWLDYHRDTLLHKCAGLTEVQLKTASVEPSDLTLLGIVRHMTENERWFGSLFTGEEVEGPYGTEDNPSAALEDIGSADAEADLAAFRVEVDKSRNASTQRELDEAFEDEGEVLNLRSMHLHMIEEYARHNGHADFLRERLDGATGD